MSKVQIFAAIALFYAIYVVGLYPLLLSGIARRWPRPVRRGPYLPSVSIIVATHNGAAFLKEKLDSIFALDYPRDRMQVIVVSDGSTDATADIAEQYANRITFLSIEKSGKPIAINRGVAVSSGDVVVLTDVRQRLAPDSLRCLAENLADPSVGVVSAELQIRTGDRVQQENIGAYWRFERWLRFNLSSIDSIFGATGSYYALRRELFIPIPKDALLDDMYLPLHAFFEGYRLVVDPRAKMYDYPTNLAVEFGRKVRTLAGNYQILRAYPELLSFRNRLLFHFLSYKFARLFLPFVLMAGAVCSLAGGGKLAVFSAVSQAALYTAALLDPKIPERALLKKLTSPTRTFFVMMLAATCAVSIWFVPPERLWRTTRVVRRDVTA